MFYIQTDLCVACVAMFSLPTAVMYEYDVDDDRDCDKFTGKGDGSDVDAIRSHV